MKVKLTIQDRRILSTLLPFKGGLEAMQVVVGIIELIKYTPEEIKEYNIVTHTNGLTTWDTSKDTEGKEYEFNKMQTDYIIEKLKDMDNLSEITLQHLPLYFKFFKNTK
jgi:hypothetical protein